jgi:polyisoprenoid-binding protein YceI
LQPYAGGMRRVVLVILIPVLLIGGILAWYLLRADTANEAALPKLAPITTLVQPSSSGATTPAVGASGSTIVAAGSTSADGTWNVAPGADTFVGYRVDEVFAAGAVNKTAVGRTPGVTGKVVVAGATISEASFEADMTGLKSDEARRDSQIKVKGIESTKFPKATFVLTSPIDLGGPPKIGAELPVKANGKLTLHGVTKVITLDLKARWSGDRVDVAGKTEILMADYAIEPPSIPAIVTVENKGILELQLAFTR